MAHAQQDMQHSTDDVEDMRSWSKALEGVRFGALSAPGNSGARPEHLRDAITCKPRASAAQLGRAISSLSQKACAGLLDDTCRWILESRLVFFRKKSGTVPRPIRIGELWRRTIAKKMANDFRPELRSLFLKARQFGIAIPGGTEALIHL